MRHPGESRDRWHSPTPAPAFAGTTGFSPPPLPLAPAHLLQLEQFQRHMDGADRHPHLDQEQDERQQEQQHRQREHPGRRDPQVESRERLGEQQRDEQAHDDPARHRRRDRIVDHVHPPVDRAQFGDDAVMFVPFGRGPAVDQVARTIDDARQPPGQDVEQRARRDEQEHRRDRQLDRLGDRAEACSRHPAATDGVFTPCICRNFLMLRAACRMRCSFSTIAMRTKPSPSSP